MGLVMDLAERVLVLDFGTPHRVGTPPEVQRNPHVIRAYLGEEHSSQFSMTASPTGQHQGHPRREPGPRPRRREPDQWRCATKTRHLAGVHLGRLLGHVELAGHALLALGSSRATGSPSTPRTAPSG